MNGWLLIFYRIISPIQAVNNLRKTPDDVEAWRKNFQSKFKILNQHLEAAKRVLQGPFMGGEKSVIQFSIVARQKDEKWYCEHEWR